MSFVQYPGDCHFSLYNIPFGIISTSERPNPRPATAIGEYALDIAVLLDAGVLNNLPSEVLESLQHPTLNKFAALSVDHRRQTRQCLQDLLKAESSLDQNARLKKDALIPLRSVTMHLPMAIGDYTDFYASKNHAMNVGSLFRGKGNELMPNWLHLPVGYHGRASSVVVSGTNVKRPSGQKLNQTTQLPEFGECSKLDIEVEFACFISKENAQGDPIPIDRASEYIFGYVVMNDWSARDLQAWEYVPLGPFNGKNFATTISPWVVVPDALEQFLVKSPIPKEKQLLPYLDENDKASFYDINFDVNLKLGGKEDAQSVITRTNSKQLYYSFPQMIAHHTVGGCNLRTGDLIASGTISGDTRESVGSLLELTMNGKSPLNVNGVTRSFLDDGDEVNIIAYAGQENQVVGFGDCKGLIIRN